MTAPQGDLPDYLTAPGATAALIQGGNLALNEFIQFSVAAYNSLTIEIAPVAAPNPICLFYQWIDQSSGLVLDEGVLSSSITTPPAGIFGPSWQLPVVAGQLKLMNLCASAMQYRVIGQPQDSAWLMNHCDDPSRLFNAVITASAPANSTFTFASTLNAALAVPAFPAVTSYNGRVSLGLNTAAGTNGVVEALWCDAAGAQFATMLLADPAGGVQVQTVGHPRAFCTWRYRLLAAAPAAAHNAILHVSPAT